MPLRTSETEKAIAGRFAHLGILLFTWLTMSAAGAASAHSGIYRCIGEDDVPVFSDRTCNALGIHDHQSKPDGPTALAPTFLRHDCSRKIDMLQTRVRVALENGDVNQLAGLYHWTEASMNSADMVMSELQAISSQRLVAIEVDLSKSDGADHPVKLWLNQHGPERPGQTIRTGFNLVMNSGCWWLDGR